MVQTFLKNTRGSMVSDILHMKINKDLEERLRKLAALDGSSLHESCAKKSWLTIRKKEGELRAPRSASPP